MLSGSSTFALVASFSLGLGMLDPTGAFAFARMDGGFASAGPIVRGPVFPGGDTRRGDHLAFYRGTPSPMPQMKCIDREKRILRSLDPWASSVFIGATAAHLCGK